ncbi:TPA: ATP-binding protein [Photobacterium damselae]
MRKIYTLLLLYLFSASSFAYAPIDQKENILTSEEISWLNNQDEIRYGVLNYDWPPYYIHKKNNDIEGIYIDYANDLNNFLEINNKSKFIPYSSIKELENALVNDEIDAVVGLSPTLRRNKLMWFTHSLYQESLGIIIKNSIIGFDADAIADLKWGCVTSSSYCDVLITAGGQHLQQTKNLTEAITLFKQGEIDAILSDYVVLSQQEDDINNARIISADWLRASTHNIAIQKNNIYLRDIFNKVIEFTPQGSETRIKDEIKNQTKNINAENKLTKVILGNPDLKKTSFSYTLPENLVPFSSINTKKGFTHDLLNIISMETGLEFNYIKTNNDADYHKLLLENKIDFFPIANTHNINNTNFNITEPYTTLKYAVITTKDRPEISKLSDLKKFNIGMIKSERYFINADKNHYKINSYYNYKNLIDNLLQGKVDYVIVVYSSFMTHLKQRYGINDFRVAYIGNDLVFPISMAINKDNNILAQVLNLALKSVPAEDISQLRKKYQPSVILKGFDESKVILWTSISLFIVITIVALFLFWSNQLKKEVKRRENAEKKAIQQRDLLNEIIESIPSMLLMQDTNNQRVFWNNNYRETFSQFWDQNNMLPSWDEYEKSTTENATVLKNGLDINNTSKNNLRQTMLPDGTTVDLIYTKKLIKDRDDNKLGVMTVLTDVSDLIQAQDKAERAMQARTHFLATMSHELRTPIASMIGLIDILETKNPSQEQSCYIKNLKSSTNHLLYLVNDILDFSQIEAGQLKLDYQPCRWLNEIGLSLTNFAQEAQHKGVKFNLFWQPTRLTTLTIDSIRVNQVINNLLSNAVKFTEAGSISVYIELTQHSLLVKVIDTGIGIHEENIKRLFSPFEQAETTISRTYGGTGLGLSICKQLVEMMNGKIELHSQLNEGTTVSFKVPFTHGDIEPIAQNGPIYLEKSNPTIEQWLKIWDIDYRIATNQIDFPLLQIDATYSAQHSYNISTDPLFPGQLRELIERINNNDDTVSTVHKAQYPHLLGRILVTEDHQINQIILNNMLTQFGIQADFANDGEEALNLWQQNHYDLLLTDCHMPNMDGYELASQIRQGTINSHVPIIGITADCSSQSTTRGSLMGMNHVMFKPYGIDELYAQLTQYLSVSLNHTAPLEQIKSPENISVKPQWLSTFSEQEPITDIAQVFVFSMKDDVEALTLAINQGNSEQIRRIAHRVKGALSLVKLEHLANMAANLQASAEAETDFSLITQQATALQKEITAEIETTSNWLSTYD